MLGVIWIIDARFLPFLKTYNGIIPKIQPQPVPRPLNSYIMDTPQVDMWGNGIRIDVGMKPFTLYFYS